MGGRTTTDVVIMRPGVSDSEDCFYCMQLVCVTSETKLAAAARVAVDAGEEVIVDRPTAIADCSATHAEIASPDMPLTDMYNIHITHYPRSLTHARSSPCL